MFLNTSHLNEGGCRENCSEGRKRELKEGENPKSTRRNWQQTSNSTHANFNWQKLRD